MNIKNEDQFEIEDQGTNKTDYKKLGLRIKALELAVDLLKTTPKFTNKDVLKLAYYFYDFLDSDVEISIKQLGFVE